MIVAWLAAAALVAVGGGVGGTPLQDADYRDAACSRGGMDFPAGWTLLQPDRDTYSCLDPRRNPQARVRMWDGQTFPRDGGGPHAAAVPSYDTYAQAAPMAGKGKVASSFAPTPQPAPASVSDPLVLPRGTRSYADDLADRREEAARPPAPVSRSPAARGTAANPARLREAVDAIIQLDARAWVWNTYDAGSVGEVDVTNDGSVEVARAAYTYNGGAPGWIAIRFSGEDVNCIEYHDFAGTCRGVGANPARQALVMGMIGLAGAAMMSSGSSHEGNGMSESDRDLEMDINRRNTCQAHPDYSGC